MQTTEKKSYIPSETVFKHISHPDHPDSAVISGKCLKYIESKLPVIHFIMPEDRFLEFKNSLGTDSFFQKKIIIKENEVKIIDTDDREKRDYHYIYRPSNSTRENGPLIFTTDLLLFNVSSLTWEGNASALEDLHSGKIRLQSQKELQSRDILEICAMCSMMDGEPDRNLFLQMKESYSVEIADQIPRKQMLKIFQHIMIGKKPSRAFLLMDEAGILNHFLPELARGKGLSQNQYHKHDIFYHSIYTCDAVDSPDLKLRLAGLFHDLGKVDTRRVKPGGEATFHNHEMVSTKHADRIMRRFGFDSLQIKPVKFLVRNHMFHYTDEWTDKAIRRFINRVGPDELEELINLRLADRKGSGKRTALPRAIKDMMRHIEEVRAREAEIKVKDLAIDGHTLHDMGLNPGPEMGRILKELLEFVKAGELPNDEDTLREIAIKKIASLKSADPAGNFMAG